MSPFIITSLILFIVWLALFFTSRETQKEQIIMSGVGLIMTPTVLLIAATNYRTIGTDPLAFGIEDLLFGFSLFGIAAIIYHVLLGRHLHRFKTDRLRLKNPAAHWTLHLTLVLSTWICLSLAAIAFFEILPMQAIIFGAAMVGLYIIASRHDLLMDALISSLLTAALIFALEQIFFVRLFPEAASTFWQWNSLSRFVLGGIPMEEVLWAGVVGFTVGPMYEWLRRFRF